MEPTKISTIAGLALILAGLIFIGLHVLTGIASKSFLYISFGVIVLGAGITFPNRLKELAADAKDLIMAWRK